MVWRNYLLPAFLLLAFAAICGYRLADKWLDFDERYTLNIATGLGGHPTGPRTFGTFIVAPLPKAQFTSADYWRRFRLGNTVATAVSDNGQAIPYFSLLHGWISVAGLTVARARALSVLFLMLAGLLLYSTVRKTTGSTLAAALALGLLLFNGFLIDLARYARFYTFGILLVTLFAVLVMRLRRTAPPAAWASLGLLGAVMVINQYFSGLILAAGGLFLLRHHGLRGLRPYWGPLLLGFITVLLIWLFPLQGRLSLVSIGAYHSSASANPHALWGPTATLPHLLTGLAANLATAVGAPTVIAASGKTWLNIGLAAPVWLLVLLAARRAPARYLDWFRFAAWVFVLQAGVSLVHALLTGRMLLFITRYWTFTLPFAIVVAALSAALLWREGSRIVRALVVVALLLVGLRTSYTIASTLTNKAFTSGGRWECIPAAAAPDYEGLAHTVAREAGPKDTVVYKTWRTAQCVNWFLKGNTTLRQAVDSTQAPEVAIRQGIIKKEVAVPIGTPAASRPCN